MKVNVKAWIKLKRTTSTELKGWLLFDVYRVTSRGKCSIKQKSPEPSRSFEKSSAERLNSTLGERKLRDSFDNPIDIRFLTSWKTVMEQIRLWKWKAYVLLAQQKTQNRSFEDFLRCGDDGAQVSCVTLPKISLNESRQIRVFRGIDTITPPPSPDTNVRNVILAFEPFDFSRKITLSIAFHNSP